MSRFDRIQNLMKSPLDALGARRRKLLDELRARPGVESARARIDALVEKMPPAVRAPLQEETLTLDAVRRAASAAGEALGAALRKPEAPTDEAPAEAPADEASADEASADEASADEASADEASADTPTEEAAADDAPAEAPSVEADLDAEAAPDEQPAAEPEVAEAPPTRKRRRKKAD